MCTKHGGVAQAPTRDNWSPGIILKAPVVDDYLRPSDSYDWKTDGIIPMLASQRAAI